MQSKFNHIQTVEFEIPSGASSAICTCMQARDESSTLTEADEKRTKSLGDLPKHSKTPTPTKYSLHADRKARCYATVDSLRHRFTDFFINLGDAEKANCSMPDLRLSEAIRLGSLTINDPAAGDIDSCAIAMALMANGGVDAYLQPDWSEEDWERDDKEEENISDTPNALPLRPNETNRLSTFYFALRSHQGLLSIYPWLEKATSNCPWCDALLRSTELLHHPFDEHVMSGRATIDALASWIAQLEPEPNAPVPSRPVRDLGLSVRFSDEAEKRTVIEEAAAAGMKPHEYVAAAARLVTERHLSNRAIPEDTSLVATGTEVSYAPYIRGERSSHDFHLNKLLPIEAC